MNTNSYTFNGNNYSQIHSNNFYNPPNYTGSYVTSNHPNQINGYFNNFANNGLNYVPQQSSGHILPYKGAYITSSQQIGSKWSRRTSVMQKDSAELMSSMREIAKTHTAMITKASTFNEQKSAFKPSKQPLINDLPDKNLISSSNDDSVEVSETNSRKVKLNAVKSAHFNFLIPRLNYKIRHWKASKSRSRKNVVEEQHDQPMNRKTVDVDELVDSFMNLKLHTEIDEKYQKTEELSNEFNYIQQEIIAISIIKDDIDSIILILKHRKQQKAHPLYEPVIAFIIATRIMSHKRIMCHYIRGRQRSKRKRKFWNFPSIS